MSCANSKRNRLPKAVNSYWGRESQTSAVAGRKCPLWRRFAENSLAVNKRNGNIRKFLRIARNKNIRKFRRTNTGAHCLETFHKFHWIVFITHSDIRTYTTHFRIYYIYILSYDSHVFYFLSTFSNRGLSTFLYAIYFFMKYTITINLHYNIKNTVIFFSFLLINYILTLLS